GKITQAQPLQLNASRTDDSPFPHVFLWHVAREDLNLTSVLCVTAMYFFDIVDSIVALVLPFKPFHLLYSHIKSSSRNTVEAMITCLWNITKGFGHTLFMVTGLCSVVLPHRSPYTIPRRPKDTNYPLHLTSSVLVSLNKPENSFPETTDLLQLSNALLFMDMKLGNHIKISSQVRNLAFASSPFTDKILKLDSGEFNSLTLQNHLPEQIFKESIRRRRGDIVISQSKPGKPKAQLECFGKAEAFHLQQELSLFSPQVYLSNVVDETTGLELMYENFGELSWKSN
ncbi:hypothetical protein PSTT_04213, partial [Puccinia striiformis]